MLQQTIIINDFPCGYGKAIYAPTIQTRMGHGNYGLDLEGNWWEISHQVWNHNWDYAGNKYGKEQQKAYEKLKEFLLSLNRFNREIFGWRGNLWKEHGNVLLKNCYGHQQDDHDKAIELHGKSLIISLNDFWDDCPFPSSHIHPIRI